MGTTITTTYSLKVVRKREKERERGEGGGEERDRVYGGGRIILAKDEEVKRVGREMRRKNGRMRRHTAGHEDEDRGARREGRK